MRQNAIIQKLLEKESIDTLESILEHDVALLRLLQSRIDEGSMLVGSALTLREYQLQFADIKEQVDSFLGVADKGIVAPEICRHNTNSKYALFGAGLGLMAAGFALGGSIDYRFTPLVFTGFAPIVIGNLFWQGDDCKGMYLFRKMYINDLDAPSQDVLPIIAHEYVHHVQRKMGVLPFNPFSSCETTRKMLQEGHACGVERNLVYQLAQQRRDDAFIYHNLKLDIPKLKRLYTWLCTEKKRSVRSDFEEKGLLPHLEVHAVGLGYFLVREAMEGAEIYSQWIEKGHPDYLV